MLTRGLTTYDVIFAVVMLSLFTVLLLGILVVMFRLSRSERRVRRGHCPRCGRANIERRPFLREGERVEDSKHVAWYCTACNQVVHIGPDTSRT